MANEATLFEHADGRYAVGTGSPAFTHDNPAWHRVGPVDVSALTAPVATEQAQAVAAGWKLVPIEPTEEMLNAGKKMLHNSNGRAAREKCGRILSAMLAASPEAAPAAMEGNPYSDHRARYWQDGFDGKEIDATTRGGALAAWNEGRYAAATPDAPSAVTDVQAMKNDFNRLTDHCWMNLPRSEEILWEKAWKAGRDRAQLDHETEPAAGYEHYAAIREGHRNAAEDAWFSALPNIEPRRAFQAGFDAGYNTRDAALAQPAPVQSEPDYEALEREHMGDPEKQTGIYSPRNRLGSWLSAALEDPAVCDAMKSDIRDWFVSGEPAPVQPTTLSGDTTTATYEYLLTDEQGRVIDKAYRAYDSAQPFGIKGADYDHAYSMITRPLYAASGSGEKPPVQQDAPAPSMVGDAAWSVTKIDYGEFLLKNGSRGHVICRCDDKHMFRFLFEFLAAISGQKPAEGEK